MSALHLLLCSFQRPLFCPCHYPASPAKVPTFCPGLRGCVLQGWGGVPRLVWQRAERREQVRAGGDVERI